VPVVGSLAPREPLFSARASVRLPCCTCGVAFSRQQVVLPGGQAYWTVLDEAFEVAEPFDGFLRWLRLVNGRAESTTRQYASALAEWANWLVSVGERDDLVRWAERLGAFRFHLMTSPVSRPGSGCGRVRSPERVDGVLAAIRSFYRYAVARRLVAGSVNDVLYEVVEAGGPRVAWMEDPPARIARPLHRGRGAAGSEVSYVSLGEFEAMLAAPGSVRDKLLICLLGLGGVRVEEAVTLRRGQMHLMESSRELGCAVPGPHLHVRGKGDRSRWVPANPYLVAVYVAYMVERSAIAAADGSDLVLVNLWGGEIGAAMTTGRARRVVARLARRAQIARHVTPHQFRHGLATQLVERGRPLDEVQRILGHAQYETTRRYVTTTPARLRAAIESVPLPGAVP
jgi:integrase/recombinase XerD